MSLHHRALACFVSAALAIFSSLGYAQQKGPVQSIVTPANPPLSVGNTLSFTVQKAFFEGVAHGAAEPAVTARWISDTPSVVSIDPVSGLATAHAAGTATITAISGPAHASTVVQVPAAALTSVSIAPLTPSVPKGLPQQFTATAHYADSSTLDATSVATWSSSDQTLATIDSKGLAKTLLQGSPTITAQYGGFNPSTVLTIGPPVLVSIAVTPNNPGVALGLTQQFTATGTLTDNTTQDLTSTATWSSTTTSVATINTTGLAQTVAQGSTTIKAVSNAITGSTLLTVLPPALVSISIGGNSSVHLPRPAAFAAIGNYSDGSTQDLTTTATWGSSSTGVATVNSAGFASTLSAGPTTITATGPNNIQGTLSLTVLSPPVPRFAYVIAPDAHSLSYFVVDPVTAQLRSRGYLLIGSGFQGIVADPLGRFLYVTGQTTILEYAVNADGSLSSVGSLPVTLAGTVYAQPVIDPAGKFLYAATNSSSVAAFAINASTGALTVVTGSPFAAGSLPGPIVIDARSRFLYVANLTGSSISGYTINSSTGALTPVPGSPRATVTQPGVAIDSLGRRLYAQGFNSSSIDAFNIDGTTGALTRMNGAPFASINNNRGAPFLLDPAEKFGYIYTNSGLAVFSVDLTSGALTQLNGSPFMNAPEVDFISSSGKFTYATPPGGSPVLVSNFPSSNGIPTQTSQMLGQSSFGHVFALVEGAQGVSVTPQYVYATNMSDNNVSAFSMNPATGALTGGITGSPFGTGTAPASISVDPTGSFAFVANSGSNNVSAYTISNTGALAAVTGSPFAAGTNPTSLFADISGRLLYVANTGDDDVSGYSINRSNGVLSALFNSPYAALLAPSAVVTDPAGQNAFVSAATSPSNQLLNYTIDVAGSSSGHVGVLQNNSSGQAPAGTNPQGIATLPSGAAVYVASKGSNSIFAFGISGCVACITQPQPLGSFPAHTQPVAVAVDPKGRFLYAANFGSNDISIYAINTDGTLVAFPGGPQSTGTAPHALTVDPSGNFLLVADSGSNDISVFSINQGSGALTPVAGSPFATDNDPVSVTVTGVVQ
ncbi:MAG TPA: beta-propeller fold lactonase family protein [Terriglobales bacterium]|jgi:6-phosphogluconolactonase (cycloisomerase 2 family)|nr:beta-propeller fold lactonase family protein [Terriglobales bacterium]